MSTGLFSRLRPEQPEKSRETAPTALPGPQEGTEGEARPENLFHLL
jgi:hypothetical protein